MFGFHSVQELLVLIVICTILYLGGVWPAVMKALRELRGDAPPEASGAPSSAGDLDLCYRMLGLSPSASWEEIERAYRAKAKLHHPDRGGDGDTMRALNEAYSKLKRVKKR
jgi:DnaJ-domain-containing protein 1